MIYTRLYGCSGKRVASNSQQGVVSRKYVTHRVINLGGVAAILLAPIVPPPCSSAVYCSNRLGIDRVDGLLNKFRMKRQQLQILSRSGTGNERIANHLVTY